MKHTISLVFLVGIIIAFNGSSLTHFVSKSDSDQDTNFWTGICFMFFGLGSLGGGYLCGLVSDKLKLIHSANIIGFCYILACVTSLFCYFQPYYVLVCVIFCFWGFMQYFSDGWMLIACSRVYKGDLQSFAINKQFHSVSFVLYEVFIIATENSVEIKYTLCVLLLLVIPVFLGFSYLQQNQRQDFYERQSLYSSEQKFIKSISE